MTKHGCVEVSLVEAHAMAANHVDLLACVEDVEDADDGQHEVDRWFSTWSVRAEREKIACVR